MSSAMDRDKIKIRNATLGVVFSEAEEVTSQVKGTLGTGVATDFLFGVGPEGAWMSFEQQREQTAPDGSTTKNPARVTVYLDAKAAAAFLEALEDVRLNKARDESADWNPFK